MTKPMVGTTYPTVTEENIPKGAAFARIMVELPGLQLWSVYYDDDDMPNWTGEDWFDPEHEGIRWFVLSFKTANVNLVATAMATMPAHLRGRVIVILHHEPDQWRSTSDNRGDPSPAVWKQRQVDFANLRDGAVWENWIQFWACFTEDRLRTAEAFWRSNWGSWMLANASLFDGVAWDVFNIGRSVTRTGAEMFTQICAFNREGGWTRIMVREWGQVTPVDSPVDSSQVADAVANHYLWMDQNAQDLNPMMVWYYNHNNTLTDPSGQRPGRPQTLAVIRECIEDATSDEPDPDDPQYQLGYAAGWNDRQSEVDEAKANGRLEAFGETVIWASEQA